jgi:hypothetical protein
MSSLNQLDHFNKILSLLKVTNGLYGENDDLSFYSNCQTICVASKLLSTDNSVFNLGEFETFTHLAMELANDFSQVDAEVSADKKDTNHSSISVETKMKALITITAIETYCKELYSRKVLELNPLAYIKEPTDIGKQYSA